MKKLLFLLAVAMMVVVPAAHAQSPTFPFLYTGGYGTFQATLYANGVPYTLPTGSTYVEKVTWSITGDTAATVSWNAATTLATVNVPANDPNTSLTLVATVVDPAGNTETFSFNVPILPPPTIYTIGITQQSSAHP